MKHPIILIPILLLAPVVGCAVYLNGARLSPLGIQRVDIIVAVVLAVVLFLTSLVGYRIGMKRVKAMGKTGSDVASRKP